MQAAAKEVVFLGSKPVGAACFEILLRNATALGYRVVAVGTQARKEFFEEQSVTALALREGLPLLDNDDAIPPCDLIISVQHHHILSAATLAKARQAAINLHMAPLPEYRGTNQFSYAIMEGRTEFGTTLHLMDARIDHGDILFQRRFPIPKECWIADLYDLTVHYSVAMFEACLPSLIRGDYEPLPQRHAPGAEGSTLHYRDEINELKNIPAGLDAAAFSRRLRATAMPGFEPPYSIIAGRKVYYTLKNDEA